MPDERSIQDQSGKTTSGKFCNRQLEPLYCGHFGTLEIVLSIEVFSIHRDGTSLF